VNAEGGRRVTLCEMSHLCRLLRPLLPTLLLGTALSAAAAPEIFYLAPNGSDQWSGKSATPNRSRTDGPLATLPAALLAARTARTNAPGGITILLRAGRYELAAPLVLTPEDSGASAAAPLTLAAYPGESPVLSGGRRVTGWQPTVENPAIWQTTIPDVRAGKWYFRSLFVRGRATRARTPNAGSFFAMAGARFADRPVQFKFKPGDLQAAWANEPDAELVAYEKWTDFRQHIRRVDPEKQLVELSGEAAPHTREDGAQYFVENTAGSLDAPGEWQLNRQTGVLRYWPRPGEDLSQTEVIVPRLNQLLQFKGDYVAQRPVKHVILRGLTFSHTDWSLPANGYTDPQAAVHIPGDVRGETMVDCAIEDCTFTQLAGYGVEFGRGCQRNRIVGCNLFDLGAGGIRIGETGNANPSAFDANHSHIITDNHLRSLGRIFPPAVGVLILQSGTNRVAHNHIHDLYYTAVSVGWNWGYQETPCRENKIEFNHLHDIGQRLLSDMGAVYTLGIQRGTVVHHNLIHDVNSYTYGGWGLYPDEGSTGILWENNVVYRTKSAGFHQHYGRENRVRNNIFAYGQEHQIMRSREEPHTSFSFTHNLIYFDRGELLGSTWQNDHFVMDHNLYFDARPGAGPDQLKFAGATLAQWRARGHDTHSVIADPLFVAPQRDNFALRPGSPALKLGFQPIDLRTVGVRLKKDRETK
jgi:hypothetical protein